MLFETLARTNAEFLRSARLPGNAQVARDLGRVLAMRVHFHHGAWEATPRTDGPIAMSAGSELIPPVGDDAIAARLVRHAVAESGVVRRAGGWEAVAMPVRDGFSLVLLRPRRAAFAFLLEPGTLIALGLFWSGSGALAWAIARGVVQSHEGRIEVRNVTGGCEFEVDLPPSDRPTSQDGRA